MIVDLISQDTDIPMSDEQLVGLEGVVRKHPWWIQRARLTERLLSKYGVKQGSRVLDAGCGWGVTLEVLEARGLSLCGLDVSRAAVESLDTPYRTMFLADITRPLPLDKTGVFDAVLLLDVIEHLDDDVIALKNVKELLGDSGLLFVSVPSSPRLFSNFDKVQGHRRRYTRTAFSDALAQSGLATLALYSWGMSTYPLVAFQRLVGKDKETYAEYLKLPSQQASAFLSKLYALDSVLTVKGLRLPSTSLFAVCRVA